MHVYMCITDQVPMHTIMFFLNVSGCQWGNWHIVLSIGGGVRVEEGEGVGWVQGTQWEKLAQMEPQTHRAALNVSCTAQEGPWDPRGPLADMSTVF